MFRHFSLAAVVVLSVFLASHPVSAQRNKYSIINAHRHGKSRTTYKSHGHGHGGGSAFPFPFAFPFYPHQPEQPQTNSILPSFLKLLTGGFGQHEPESPPPISYNFNFNYQPNGGDSDGPASFGGGSSFDFGGGSSFGNGFSSVGFGSDSSFGSFGNEQPYGFGSKVYERVYYKVPSKNGQTKIIDGGTSTKTLDNPSNLNDFFSESQSLQQY